MSDEREGKFVANQRFAAWNGRNITMNTQPSTGIVIQINANELYDSVSRSMSFKGKDGEHQAACQRVREVVAAFAEPYFEARNR